ncbi:hypothetical protein BGX28_000500 [Mortierella sp. GBA30]|nr:hypothetical protein BGX28_000500 [Mortierella sp. GBA30]
MALLLHLTRHVYSSIGTQTIEHTEIYNKLVNGLKEKPPTNDSELEIARCWELKTAYTDDLAARRAAFKEEAASNKSYDADIELISSDIPDRLDKDVLSSVTEPTAVVFYSTMKGDYCRHIAEYLTDHDQCKRKVHRDKALNAILNGKEAAMSSSLSSTDPFYLELIFSLATFFYSMEQYRTARMAVIVLLRWDTVDDGMKLLDEGNRKRSNDIRERVRLCSNYWAREAIYNNMDEDRKL